MREAFHIATSGRPGPVLVDIPKDVLLEMSDEPLPETVSIRGYNPTTRATPCRSARPPRPSRRRSGPCSTSGAGSSSSGGAAVFRRIVEAPDVPVITSLMGIGAFPSDHPLFLGMLGMHGTWAANTAVQNCDLLFAVGARFDDRVTGNLATFAPGRRSCTSTSTPLDLAQRRGRRSRGRRRAPGA